MGNGNNDKNISGGGSKNINGISRRGFLKTAGATAAAFTIVPRHVLGGPNHTPPSEKLNIAGVGIGGMGGSNLQACGAENIVALCDVDEEFAGEVFEAYPQAKKYKDYRKMLEKQKDIDAVIIATPDHTHAIIALAAMELGKGVYVQKPLTHSIYEARQLQKAAKRYKVATQMGNQGHSGEGARLICEWVSDGAIGSVREVYASTDRPVWPQGIVRPEETPEVPSNLDWDLWLGPAPKRPYNPIYHPFSWRGWYDFGTGALGDMGCHILDPVFWALKLGSPESVEASISATIDPEDNWNKLENTETYPLTSIVHYNFGAREGMPPMTLHWYDGGLLPQTPEILEKGRKVRENGGMIIGDDGLIMYSTYGESPVIAPEKRRKEYELPKKTIPRIEVSHEQNWIDACKGNKEACSNFDYAAPLTEMVLLGTIALRFPGKKLKWDGANMKFTNVPKANQYLKRDYRSGWSL